MSSARGSTDALGPAAWLREIGTLLAGSQGQNFPEEFRADIDGIGESGESHYHRRNEASSVGGLYCCSKYCL